jgi:hypothetical protein
MAGTARAAGTGGGATVLRPSAHAPSIVSVSTMRAPRYITGPRTSSRRDSPSSHPGICS